MEQEREFARKLVSDGKKDRALLLLKKKKRMEKTLLDLDGKLEVLEKMVSDIEFAQIEIKLIDGLKSGNEALKHLNQLLSVENVEEILSETKEAAERQQEISNLLVAGGSFTAEDESDLEQELQQLVAAEVKLPDVPNHEIESVEEETEAKEPAPVRRKEKSETKEKVALAAE